MPWQECSLMNSRYEFLSLVMRPGSNFSQLCRRFGISRKTGYKWLKRSQEVQPWDLGDRSRRPHTSPHQTAADIEAQALAIRDTYTWGARKVAHCLARDHQVSLAKSTVHSILERYGRVNPPEVSGGSYQCFEQERPNQLWQMDFKGHFALGSRERCHPLTVLDDHSRYALCLHACRNQLGDTVKAQLTATFRLYGLPERMLMDNGSPWGNDREHHHTSLTVWLLQLGVAVSHSRPYHPQTQGKDERFHRSLKVEVLAHRIFADFERIQRRFDEWRHCYNHWRPHEALQMKVPADRYQVSQRSFPEQLPPLEYGSTDRVRKVQGDGKIFFHNREFRIGKAFRGHRVGLRPTLTDGLFEVYFATHCITTINLKTQ
jgi:transposase InsO family protein